MLKYVYLTVFNLFMVVMTADAMGIRVNVTESYPMGIYKADSYEWKIHDVVEVCLPIHVRDLAIHKGYMSEHGRCGGAPSVIKRVHAVAGDRVEVGDRVTINGVEVENSTVMDRDSGDKPLAKAQSKTLSVNEVWVMSTFSPISYDSRYFGAVDRENIIARLMPVWTY